MKIERPDTILFGLEKADMLVGYGGFVHVSWADKRAELSFLVDPDRACCLTVYEQDFRGFLGLIQQIGFGELQLNRLFTETYAFRHQHIALLEANGLRQEGRLREHVVLQGKATDSLVHGILKIEYEARACDA